jgi:hypothetical protein
VRAARLARTPRIIDGRNKLDPERWRAAGWTVHGLGRGAPVAQKGRLRALLTRQ